MVAGKSPLSTRSVRPATEFLIRLEIPYVARHREVVERRAGELADELGGRVSEIVRKNGRQHGTRSCYVLGCRRPECVAANRVYMRNYLKENSRVGQ